MEHEPEFTLQQRLTRVMASPLGTDARLRVIDVTEDKQHKGCLNFTDPGQQAFLADLMHLDGRGTLPMWIEPTEPKPVAEVVPRELAEGEASLGEPVYLLVRGNHVAAIERLGFRNSNLQRYLNGLLKKAGELEDGAAWKLVPKIEATGGAMLTGGVKKIVVRPHAALVGDGPSQAPETAREKKNLRRKISAAMEDLMVQGQTVFDMMRAAGADQTKLENLRAQMSNDLVLKARLEISVASVRQKSQAEISPDLVHQALADLAVDGDVFIATDGGRSDGKLIQLMHKAEVLETGGLIDWQRATQALSSAMAAWAAKGSIDLST